jgi:hypothetical protein
MARDLLRHSLRDACAYHILHRSPPEIMKKLPHYPNSLAGSLPCLAEVLDLNPFPVKYPRAMGYDILCASIIRRLFYDCRCL